MGKQEREYGIEVKLGAVINREVKEAMSDALKPVHHAILALQRAEPLTRRIEKSGQSDASGNLTIKWDSPNLRMEWKVRRYVISGPDPTVAPTLSLVRVYRSEASPFNLIDAWNAGDPWPTISTWGEGELDLLGNEPLLFVFGGMAANSMMYTSGQIMQKEGVQRDTRPLPSDHRHSRQ